MTIYEWTMICIALVGGLITIGTIVVSVSRAIGKIELETESKVSAIRMELDKRMQTQDEVYREVANGLRKFIELVEAEMHRIEIWGRDNYVQQKDHDRALDEIKADIRELASSLKADFREIKADIKEAFSRGN